MNIKRRKYLKSLVISTLFAHIQPFSAQGKQDKNSVLKPQRLQAGDTVGLMSPVGIIEAKDLEQAKQTFGSLGLKVKLGKHVLDRYGYLAGQDSDRATLLM
ncbi:LD-carboxypeptidase [Pelatocladus sp. BLCC-F211]|uniref:LD-carboxypeptidase n=1 Tax=Pelatocladus sp. BLCC-F211 TaxID=3342752 RepID=UPI0035BB9899